MDLQWMNNILQHTKKYPVFWILFPTQDKFFFYPKFLSNSYHADPKFWIIKASEP